MVSPEASTTCSSWCVEDWAGGCLVWGGVNARRCDPSGGWDTPRIDLIPNAGREVSLEFA